MFSYLKQALLTTSKHRITALDAAKGITVLLMVFTHTLQFSLPPFHPLELFKIPGDLAAVTSFITLFGCSMYLAFFTRPLSFKLIFKICRLLATYYGGYILLVLAIRGIYTDLRYVKFTIPSLLLLQNSVHFTEFLVPFFIILPLGLILRLMTLKVKSFNLSLAVMFPFVGLLLYYAGTWMYRNLEYSSFGDLWALFYHLAGCVDCVSFPALQYMFPFTVGLSVGAVVYYLRHKPAKLAVILLFAILNCSILCWMLLPNYELFIEIRAQRWPPSIPFLLIGIIFSLSTLLLSFLLPRFVQSILAFYGTYSLHITLGHILLLILIDVLLLPRTENIVFISIQFLVALNLPLLFPLISNVIRPKQS